ncbi:hypothetical protein HMI54_013782 [Coelomomyces lativittatus]|nr:hypothetical protein HMI56_003332 [Coelomomyces lativittatus]KAJ1514657.1 hypothetical protein HMI54_013782 [Coelomomyces lativittatus]KAJ1516021.1 hypothetical protein HMI55_003131 [Coelomomyces lativittatus]
MCKKILTMMQTSPFSNDPEIHNPIDITHWLRIEAEKLGEGKMIKSENFLLFDAMSALEVMIPKTDSGITTDDDLKLPRLDQNFVATGKINDDLSDCIMFELLCAEATFLKGYGLADTLFSNVFMLYSNHIQHKTLKLYVQSTLYTVSCILNLLKGASAYEDEDFVLDDNYFDLSTPPESELLQQLFVDTSPYIKFRLHFIMAYSSLINRELEISRESLHVMNKILTDVSSIQPTKDVDRRKLGFNPSMNRRLYVHSPPRSIRLLDRKESIETWRTLISQMEWLTALPFGSSPHLLLHQFEYATHSLRFSVLPRCLLQHISYAQDMKLFGQREWGTCLFSWLQEFIPLPYKYQQLSQNGDWLQFTTMSSHIVYAYFRIFTCNTSRQRGLLLKLISVLNDFLISCEEHDRKLELKYHPGKPLYVLTNWGISILHEALIHTIKWGFELDLYVPFELATVYCYFHYLLSSYLGHLMHLPEGNFIEHNSAWILYFRSLSLISESLAVAIFHLKLPINPTSYLQRFCCFKDIFVPYFSYSKAIKMLEESSLDLAYKGFSEAMHLLGTLRKLDTKSLLGVENEEISNYIRACIRNRITLQPFLSGSMQPCEIQFIDNKLFCSLMLKSKP